MNTIRIVIFLTMSLAQIAFTQEKTDSLQAQSNLPGSLEYLQYKLEEFDFYREIFHTSLEIPLDGDKNTVRLRTEMIINQNARLNATRTETELYFLSPLYNKFLEEKKFNPVRYVLGVAQLSAVGYLAYRHIKKYGFID